MGSQQQTLHCQTPALRRHKRRADTHLRCDILGWNAGSAVEQADRHQCPPLLRIDAQASRPNQSDLFAEMMDRNDVPNKRFYRALLSVRCICACTLSGVAVNNPQLFSAAIH
jgi:hypothetical protein